MGQSYIKSHITADEEKLSSHTSSYQQKNTQA